MTSGIRVVLPWTCGLSLHWSSDQAEGLIKDDQGIEKVPYNHGSTTLNRGREGTFLHHISKSNEIGNPLI
jgi:hypothetical protein